MALKPEKLDKYVKLFTNNSQRRIRKDAKKAVAKRNRQLAKRLLDDAPIKTAYNGHAS